MPRDFSFEKFHGIVFRQHDTAILRLSQYLPDSPHKVLSLSLPLAPRTAGDVLSNLAIDHRRHPIRRLPPPISSQKAAHLSPRLFLYPFSTTPPRPAAAIVVGLAALNAPFSEKPPPPQTAPTHPEATSALRLPPVSLPPQRRPSDAGAARRGVDTRTQPSPRRPKRAGAPFSVSCVIFLAFRGRKNLFSVPKTEGKQFHRTALYTRFQFVVQSRIPSCFWFVPRV
jgi:hypothetical protein